MMVGRLQKENPDVCRVTVDLTDWLDTAEAIASVSSPAVSFDTGGYGNWTPGWNQSGAPVLITDTAPLTVSSATLLAANTKLQLLVSEGTPGLTYLVSLLVNGSTSGRAQSVEFKVMVVAPA